MPQYFVYSTRFESLVRIYQKIVGGFGQLQIRNSFLLGCFQPKWNRCGAPGDLPLHFGVVNIAFNKVIRLLSSLTFIVRGLIVFVLGIVINIVVLGLVEIRAIVVFAFLVVDKVWIVASSKLCLDLGL